MDSLIRTENVTKIYNPRKPDEVRALEEATVDIDKGEVVALKGPSGSGKTTLLSMIGCMGRPTSGISWRMEGTWLNSPNVFSP
jgi:putative ABC transport system ATP-binding protein